jgi:hypothetical protein
VAGIGRDAAGESSERADQGEVGMGDQGDGSKDGEVTVEVISTQLQHFTNSVPPRRGMQLPDGILLRHNLSQDLYFYIRTRVEDGKIKSRVFASDSPYDRQKAEIGAIETPMFDPKADTLHLEKLERLLQSWVEFVGAEADLAQEFQSFVLNDRQE